MKDKFFNMSLDILCTASLDGYFLKVNPTFIKTLGYSEEELTSQPFINLIHPEDIKKTGAILEKLQSGLEFKNFENRYRHKKGHYLTIAWSGCADLDEQMIYAIGRDVGQLKYTERRLQQIKDALVSHSIVALTDQNGTITEVNKNFCDISGYSEEELLGQNHRIVSSGKHSKGFWKKVWDTINSGKSWSGIIENKNKNGEHYTVYSIFTPLFNDQGEIESFLAIRFDKTNELNLAKSLSKTLTILEETNSIAKVGGWELIVETSELNWTDETFKILEVEKKNGQKPMLPEGLNLYVPEHQKIIENAVQRCIDVGESYSHELQLLTPNGSKKWVFTNGHANYEDNKITKISGTIQDINARKLSEIQLKEEQRKSLHNAKLATIGELSAGIAHEINNPLTVILANLSFLKVLKDEPEKFTECIQTIEKSCTRISSIAKNLVKQARKTKDNDFKAVNISQLVEEAVELTKIKSNKFHTKVLFDSKIDAEILCNEVEIEQVIINLISNSIDAIKGLEERWVKVELNECSGLIYIRVIDSGTEMTPEVAAKIFEPFYTTKEVGSGTGLGLSVSKEILDSHNSSIYIDLKSKNTCFVITIPKYI